MRASLPVVLVAMSGCALYFPGDDDPDPCVDFGGGGSGAEAPAQGQRNPETGICEYFGGGGPFPCDPECGPCPEDDGLADPIPPPTWGYCESECTFLDEQTCQDTSGCRAIYVDGSTPAFSECWSVDMTGPVQGDCDGLDAYECSRHDDCVAIHASSCDGDNFGEPGCAPAGFVRCGDESPGFGNCYDEVTCDEIPPVCPADTLPGVADGCYTGFCIPLDQCEAQPECASLAESACIGRADCAPLFRGSDCTCDDLGCTCATIEYNGCEPL
jgi:hypothetical protein